MSRYNQILQTLITPLKKTKDSRRRLSSKQSQSVIMHALTCTLPPQALQRAVSKVTTHNCPLAHFPLIAFRKAALGTKIRLARYQPSSFCPPHSSDWINFFQLSHITDIFSPQLLQRPPVQDSVIVKTEAVGSPETSERSTTTWCKTNRKQTTDERSQ